MYSSKYICFAYDEAKNELYVATVYTTIYTIYMVNQLQPSAEGCISTIAPESKVFP